MQAGPSERWAEAGERRTAGHAVSMGRWVCVGWSKGRKEGRRWERWGRERSGDGQSEVGGCVLQGEMCQNGVGVCE